jgi:hypothetical protein
MSQEFRNFLAAERLRNLIPFGLLRADNPVGWIADNPSTTTFTSHTVTFTTTPAFDASTGFDQRIVLTADAVAQPIKYLGLTTVPAGIALSIRIEQDAVGGHVFTLPANLLVDVVYKISLDPSTVTRFDLVSNSTLQMWECLAPPVIYPAS